MKNHSHRLHQVRAVLRDLEKDAPELSTAFGYLHQKTLKEGALSNKMKELMALAIGIAVRCDGCIAFHMHDALKAGATKAEILETLGVAVLMGGGPGLVYATDAYRAYYEICNDSSDYGADETFID